MSECVSLPPFHHERLILHFDINKTMIISDMGVNLIDMINSIVSESIWGVVDVKGGAVLQLSDWHIYSTIPSSQPPTQSATIITFSDYLENHLKLPRTERKQLKSNFTNPGAIGESCRESFETLLNALQIPLQSHDISNDYSFFSNDYAPSTASVADTKPCETTSMTTYHIIPSFFEVIQFLDSRSIDFRVLFRTFGTDIEVVTEEFNMFCDGVHPLFPLLPDRRMNGLGSSGINRKLSCEQCYTLKRTSNQISGLELRPTYTDMISNNQTSTCTSIIGAEETDRHLQFLFNEKRVFSLAIQDDFSWWHNCHESDDSGKVLLVDTNNSKHRSEIQIFFDDNIERDRAHIVDVRELTTFEPVPFLISNRKWIRRVEPFYSITDRNYFVKEVQDVLAAIGLNLL